MRAPSTNGVSFVMQSFVDEVAVAAGKGSAAVPARPAGEPGGRGPGAGGGGFNAARARGVLEAVRDMSNWNRRASLPKGTAQGCAFQFAHAGYVAYVAEVSVGADKKLKINKAWAAVDVGRQIVNPSSATNLVQGGFIEAMSHLMAWEITIDKGRVMQNNFGQYQPARMMQVPPLIEVKFLQTDYDRPASASRRCRRRCRRSPTAVFAGHRACASATCRSPGRATAGAHNPRRGPPYLSRGPT
jgi:isoquinoline 1-oxidoreductase beta subunit